MEADSPLDRTLSDGAAHLDLLDQLLSEGGWLEFPSPSDAMQTNTPNPIGPCDSSSFSPLLGLTNSNPTPLLQDGDNPDDTGRSAAISANPPSDESQARSGEPSPEPGGNNRWIHLGSPISSPSVEDRFMRALCCIKNAHREGNALVQLWLPARTGDRLVLTTYVGPFFLDRGCEELASYREISTGYQFSAEENSGLALGLPGRVFLGRVPEWTPDVRYFTSSEFLRVGHAQRFGVRGTIAVPVFERGGRSCLGVVEVATTTQNINYTSELESICNALQEVDLTSSEVLSVPQLKVICGGSYLAALPEILEVLKSACKTHKLPLAQTWIACIRQGKTGSRHSKENYKDCVSTVDAACYVNDPSMWSFHSACSEYHLLKGQGVVGKAFTTNEPHFSPDITGSCRTEYPLSHHARMFNLKGAVAIRLRSIRTGNADFVLEFFLPLDCMGGEEQKLLLSSLSHTIQQVCQTLRVVTTKELEDEVMLQVNELIHSALLLDNSGAEGGHGRSVAGSVLSVETSEKETSIFLELEEHWVEGFTATACSNRPEVVLPAGELFAEFKQHRRGLAKDINNHRDSFTGDCRYPVSGNATEKRHTKTEKTVSLEVLRQYFAGSLKDAAKSIGVCPTTLKRICRQHGITRWPSRKIKKVDHSLKKLQVVVDSVHGGDRAFQLSSRYKEFTKTSGPTGNLSGSITFSPVNQKDHQGSTQRQEDATVSRHLSSLHSFSSCIQSSSSSHSGSSGAKQSTQAAEFIVKEESCMEEGPSGIPERTNSQLDLCLSTQEAALCVNRSRNHDLPVEHCSSGALSSLHKDTSTWMKVKAMYGAEKVRLQLQPTWSFQDLKQEIATRFNICDASSVNLKYLDDDAEWILLTCDTDLQECIHVYRSSGAGMIKISVQSVGLS